MKNILFGSIFLVACSNLLLSQKKDIYNNVSIIGKTDMSGKYIYKYIRTGNSFTAYRIKRDSISKKYHEDNEVVSIFKNFDTIKNINLRDKKIISYVDRLNTIEEDYSYFHTDSPALTNKQKQKYKRLLNKINATPENKLYKKNSKSFTISIHPTSYTFNLTNMDVRKSIYLYSINREHSPLLCKLLIFTKKMFSENYGKYKLHKIRFRKK